MTAIGFRAYGKGGLIRKGIRRPSSWMHSASSLKAALARPFMWTVAAGGAAVFIYAGTHEPARKIKIPFLLIALSAVIFGSRSKLKVPRFKSNVSISDVFIFLAMLLFGADAAVLLAATESYFSSVPITKRLLTRLFNVGGVALSTFATALIVRQMFGPLTDLAKSEYFYRLILAACLMGAVQYVLNSGLVAVAAALRTGTGIIQTWSSHYQWISTGYLSASLAAAIIAKLDATGGTYALIATAPIVGLVYLTFLTYLKNVEASAVQSQQREQHLADLRESEERFRGAFDLAPIGMALASPQGTLLRVNRSLCRIVGYQEEELVGKSFHDLSYPEDLPDFIEHVDRVLSGENAVRQMEKRYVDRDGNPVWVHVSISLIRETREQRCQLIFQIQHIADRKRAEERLLHEAMHDSLTGLPNRAYFLERLKSALNSVPENLRETVAVLFLDLDRFKVINDSLGHSYGDRLLVETAVRLRSCIRTGDIVARLGGDEFTVLLTEVQTENDAVRAAERIQKEVAVPFKLGAYETCTTASIGIAIYRGDHIRPEEMLRDADTAMYHAKSLGKDQHAIFDLYMHARAMRLMQIETDLRRGIERGEFLLHYQPIVEIESGRLLGFEALVRWQHPERGLIPPGTFIPVAEETGWIVPLGSWVLREACAQMKLWQKQFGIQDPIYVAVNISSRQFGQVDIPDQVIQALASTGLDPHSLKLEITESVVMDNIEVATRRLERLRSIGVELSIDDFGTGYSSLSYLHRLPINVIKIDRSFVSRLGESKQDREIVRTIVLMAETLGKGVVAEGVETLEQLAELRELKCGSAQGFIFSRPVDAESAGQLIWNSLHRGSLSGSEITDEAGNVSLASAYHM